MNIVMMYQHSLSKGVMSVNHFHEQTMNETNTKPWGFITHSEDIFQLLNPQLYFVISTFDSTEMGVPKVKHSHFFSINLAYHNYSTSQP